MRYAPFQRRNSASAVFFLTFSRLDTENIFCVKLMLHSAGEMPRLSGFVLHVKSFITSENATVNPIRQGSHRRETAKFIHKP